jgi:hypothetical protein
VAWQKKHRSFRAKAQARTNAGSGTVSREQGGLNLNPKGA